jgi:hypothetical protein
MKNKVLFFYLLMLLAHIAHVLEEVWGRFWILNKIGLGVYLAGNAALFAIPIALLYGVMQRKRLAFQLSIVYAAFMGLQGIGHNVATIVSGRYHGGFAGGITGIAMLLISWPLIRQLIKAMPIKGSSLNI